MTALVMATALLLAACSSTTSEPQAASSSSSTPTTTVAPTTAAPTTSTTTTSAAETTTTTGAPVNPTTQLSDEELLERTGPLPREIPIVSFEGEYVGVFRDYSQSTEPPSHLVARSVDGVTWTTEPIVGWPESEIFLIRLAVVGQTLAAVTETDAGRALLLTSDDGRTWESEDLTDVVGEPRAFAVSSEQLAVLTVDAPLGSQGDTNIITGPTGGPFITSPFPTDLNFRHELVATDAGVFAITGTKSITGEGEAVVFTPWVEGDAAVITPADERIEILDIAARPDGSLVVAATDAIWETSDLGQTWSRSEIPTELYPIDAQIFVDDDGTTLEVTKQEIGDGDEGRVVYRLAEVWHQPVEEDWALAASFRNMTQTEDYPAAGEDSVDALPSVLGLGDDHISFRWDVRTVSVARTLSSTTEIGAFIEKIPLG